ncbi:MAG TPA: AAA family ATPase [Nitrososphaeraceae archaeon]|nr:AAA family ATPase [Nitrososphaeraceae archaeon]
MARIGITGNPGVGKHTVTDLLSKKIKNSKIIDINKIIITNQALNLETFEADLKKTRSFLLKELIDDDNDDDNVIIVGHLLPYIIKRNELDFIAILRRSPYSLIEIYKKRKYSNKKIHENIICEILGICFYDTLKVFGKKKISEIDTTYDDPEESVKKIIYNYDYKSKRQIGLVDWLDLVYKNGDVEKFLEVN